MSSAFQSLLSSSSMSTLSVLPDPLPRSSTLPLIKRSSSAKYFGRGDSRHRRRLEEIRVGLDRSQIVAPPRQVLPEDTWMREASPLGRSLEEFYEGVVRIDRRDRDIALVNINRLLNTISVGLTKLARGIGLKLLGFVKTGSLFDDTCVVSPNDIDVLVMFRCGDVTSVTPGPGFAVIPLGIAQEEEEGQQGKRKRDRWKFGRSTDGRYLSSQTVSQSLYDLLRRVLPDKSLDIQLKPFQVEDGKAQITVVWQDLTVHMSPACSVTGDRDETCMVSRPYPFDVDPASDLLWRLHFPARESKILALIEKSDRGFRKKSFKILKAIVRQEEGLRGLASYHIKTVLLRSFDLDVDEAERWQRTTIESAFVSLLTDLRDCLDAERLPHFYEPRFNLFGNVPSRVLTRWKKRVDVMVQDHSCIVRCLRRGLAEHNRKQAFLSV